MRKPIVVFKSFCAGVASLLVAGCGADPGGAGEESARHVGRAAQAASTDEPVCVTVQRGNGQAGVADAVLWENAPHWNDGANPTLRTGTSATGGRRRSLLRFDLSGVPAGASVVSASLSIHQMYKTVDSTVRVRRVTSAWDESAVTWSSFGDAYDPAVAASFTSGGGFGVRSAELSEFAQAWVSGEAANHGVLLEEDPVQGTEYRSSEKDVVEDRPKLDLCYVVSDDGSQSGGACAGVGLRPPFTPAGVLPFSTAAADLDGDGDIDLAVANYGGAT